MSIVRRAGAAVLVGCLGAFCATACVKNESSLFVKGCAQIALDTCTATADPSQVFLGEGLLDTLYTEEYTCALLVGNQLHPEGDQDTLMTETSRVQLVSADINILDGGGNLLTRANGSSASFNVPITGEVDPSSGTTPGFGLGFATLIDAATAKDLGAAAASTNLRQDVVVEVIVRARTLGGDDILAAPFHFPVEVCNGCLCTEPAGESCCDSTDKPDANCRKGEDGPVDCRFIGASCECQIDPNGMACKAAGC
jgi:hypothetical protein